MYGICPVKHFNREYCRVLNKELPIPEYKLLCFSINNISYYIKTKTSF